MITFFINEQLILWTVEGYKMFSTGMKLHQLSLSNNTWQSPFSYRTGFPLFRFLFSLLHLGINNIRLHKVSVTVCWKLPHSTLYFFTSLNESICKNKRNSNTKYYITFLLEWLLPTVGRFGIVTKDSLTGASCHERFWILSPDGSVLVGTSQVCHTHQKISQCPILLKVRKKIFV